MRIPLLFSYLLLCSFSSGTESFFDRVFNYRTMHDCFVAVTVYYHNDTFRYVVENHSLYTYMAGTNKNKLSYVEYRTDMQEALQQGRGIRTTISPAELQTTWHFHKVEISSQVRTAMAGGKEPFIQAYFNKAVLKSDLPPQDRAAIIYQLFQWEVATLTDDESGALIIPSRLPSLTD